MAKAKILIVDDEISVRTILKQILDRSEFEADTASDGVEALTKLKDGSFDIVITDINMPNMDGVALLKRIKEEYTGMPVIFITAFGKDKIIIEAMKVGLNDFIEKPFKMDAVIEIVNKHLKRKG
ncbi:response regulator [Candidatus Margulisiibacteriota bacterium]